MKKENEFCFEYMILANLIRRYMDNTNTRKYVDNLTGTNGWVIGYLLENMDHDVFQRDIENAFSIRKSTVSKIIKLMENKDLIRRESVEYDARLKKIVLTDKALEIHKMIKEDIVNVNKKFTENLTEKEAEEFLYLIRKVKKSFDSEVQ